MNDANELFHSYYWPNRKFERTVDRILTGTLGHNLEAILATLANDQTTSSNTVPNTVSSISSTAGNTTNTSNTVPNIIASTNRSNNAIPNITNMDTSVVDAENGNNAISEIRSGTEDDEKMDSPKHCVICLENKVAKHNCK